MESISITEKFINFTDLPKDSNESIKFLVDVLLKNIYPLLQRISSKFHQNEVTDENSTQIRNVYTLCSDQIRKCFLSLLEIIKLEFHNDVCLQESRHCIFERLSWCCEKLRSIEELFNNHENDKSLNSSILAPTMFFVNWIDQTFDVLHKLSSIIYKNNFKENEPLHLQWKLELVECIQGLHTSIDELLLTSMTLCKYCLPDDQHVVKARCQVVMRETKSLLCDLVIGDLDTIQLTIDNIKLPIMPSNINLLIDVLKDVLYALETNTNTALLALVVHCFSQSATPADTLRSHYEGNSKGCSCHSASEDIENCCFIREFDLHNERLLQIGSFAMSCSSDQKRILGLRSGLASLEALDPHLVPAVMLSPNSHHTTILINTWNQEVKSIMESVFLIVDPAAFADKARQMMHLQLSEIIKTGLYDNTKTCNVIDIGCVVYDFFSIYERLEPDALTCKENLVPLLRDLNKVQKECKTVNNILSSPEDRVYNLKGTVRDTNVTPEKLTKRLQLLYTLVKRINNLLNPKENEEEFYEDQIENKNVTHTINLINGNTYINSPRKQTNMTRSIFARTNIRSSTGKFPLSMLTKHLKPKNSKELSFSIRFDDFCNLSEIKFKNREPSILYSPMKTRSSLRKAVLSKLVTAPLDNPNVLNKTDLKEQTFFKSTESFVDDTSLQITDVLNQINDLTNNISVTKHPFNSTVVIDRAANNNILKLAVNNDASFKHVWNISINSSSDNPSTCNSNTTQPSDFNTLERFNDLDLVESKLSDLKNTHFETSL